jgi:hypothetical protein
MLKGKVPHQAGQWDGCNICSTASGAACGRSHRNAAAPGGRQVPLYTSEIVERYKAAGAGSAAAALPPHVFLTADAAYKAMCASQRSQSLVISGESGSGKTETTKIAMQARARCRCFARAVHAQVGSPASTGVDLHAQAGTPAAPGFMRGRARV